MWHFGVKCGIISDWAPKSPPEYHLSPNSTTIPRTPPNRSIPSPTRRLQIFTHLLWRFRHPLRPGGTTDGPGQGQWIAGAGHETQQRPQMEGDPVGSARLQSNWSPSSEAGSAGASAPTRNMKLMPNRRLGTAWSQTSINSSARVRSMLPARNRCMRNCQKGISAKAIQAARNEACFAALPRPVDPPSKHLDQIQDDLGAPEAARIALRSWRLGGSKTGPEQTNRRPSRNPFFVWVEWPGRSSLEHRPQQDFSLLFPSVGDEEHSSSEEWCSVLDLNQ